MKLPYAHAMPGLCVDDRSPSGVFNGLAWAVLLHACASSSSTHAAEASDRIALEASVNVALGARAAKKVFNMETFVLAFLL